MKKEQFNNVLNHHLEYPSSLRHTLISGGTGTGKTVTSIKMISDLVNNLDMSGVIFDKGNSLRPLLNTLNNKDNLYVHSLSNKGVNPISLNLLSAPKGVDPKEWIKVFAELFCKVYEEIDGYDLLLSALESIFEENDVYSTPENSKNINLDTLANKLKEEADKEVRSNLKKLYAILLNHLKVYTGDLKDIYSNNKKSLSIDDLISGNKIVILEQLGLNYQQRRFIVNILTSGITLHTMVENASNKKFIMFENLEDILVKDTDVIDVLFREGRAYGLSMIATSQRPSILSESILLNTSNFITHRLIQQPDVDTIMEQLIKKCNVDNDNLRKWITKSSVGYALIHFENSLPSNKDLLSESSLVKIDLLNMSSPSVKDLNNIIK